MPRITLLFLILISFQLKAQEIKTYLKQDSVLLAQFISEEELKQDSSSFLQQQIAILNKLYTNGYLEAAYNISKKDSAFIADWRIGSQYNWANLEAGNLPEYLISKIGYKSKFFSNAPFNLLEFKTLFSAIIKESDNNGRPFAYVMLDSLEIINNGISASIYYEPGPEINFDKLQVIGTDKISVPWLSAYLGIQDGKPFNQSIIDNIGLKIGALPFIELSEDPSLTFQNRSAEVTLNLSSKKSNSLDGIIGFLPNEQADGELLITGQLFFGLNNLFNSGKSLVLEWQSLKARSQLLDISYSHPNLLKSPIDLRADFNLLKEDTFFINREFQLASVYRKLKSEFSLFYRARNSSILSEIEQEEDITDFAINYYGVSYQYNSQIQQAGNINKFRVGAESALGSKKEEMILSDSLEAPSEEVSSIQYQVVLNLSNQLKVSRVFNLYVEGQAGLLLNENDLYRNDLFRVGGLRSIRGFNENFFFADRYGILKTELRLYYQPESYLFLFYDQGFLEYNVVDSSDSDNPLGIGVGMALTVRGGVLNLAYGLGRSADQNFDTRLSKFHFGYVARF